MACPGDRQAARLRRSLVRVVLLACLLTLALSLSACGSLGGTGRSGPATATGPAGGGPRDAAGLPLGPVSYEEIKSHPEATLYYPGAKVFRLIGGGELQLLTGPTSAFEGGRF